MLRLSPMGVDRTKKKAVNNKQKTLKHVFKSKTIYIDRFFFHSEFGICSCQLQYYKVEGE